LVLQREDGRLAVNDKDKANLMNEFFSNIGIKLGSRTDNFSQQIDHTGCPAPSLSELLLSEDLVLHKLKAIKTNKSVGP